MPTLRRRSRMRPFNRASFYDTVTKKLAFMAYRSSMPHIPSRALRDSMVIVKIRASKSGAAYKLFIPHYWATYVHDGRGAVRPKRGKWLVWFKSSHRDPRYHGGYPVRLADAKALDMPGDEFRRRKSEMVFAKSAKPTRGSFFFSNQHALGPFSRVFAPTLVKETVVQSVNEYLGDLKDMNHSMDFSF